MTKNNNTPPPPPDDKDLGRHALTITITAAIYEHGMKIAATSTDSRTQAVEERLKAAVLNELLRMNGEAQAQHDKQQQQQPS